MSTNQILMFLQKCSCEDKDVVLESILSERLKGSDGIIPIEGPSYGFMGWFLPLGLQTEQKFAESSFRIALEEVLKEE